MALANQEHQTKALQSLPYHLHHTTQHCERVDLVSTWTTSRHATTLYLPLSSPQKYQFRRVFRLPLDIWTTNRNKNYSLHHSHQIHLCPRSRYQSRSLQPVLPCNIASANHHPATAFDFRVIVTTFLQLLPHRQTHRTPPIKRAFGRWSDLHLYHQ